MTDHSLEATPPSEMIANALQILGEPLFRSRQPIGKGVSQEREVFVGDDIASIRRLLSEAKVRAQQQEAETRELSRALVRALSEEPDEQGNYVHLAICNGPQNVPAGTPWVTCNCLPKTRAKLIRGAAPGATP